jgi:uncharacterized protein
MWLDFQKGARLKLKGPTMVVAVSTPIQQYRALYSQARELGEYMLKKMSFSRIASVHSSSFPPEILVREEGVSTLPACHFYLHSGKKDLILFAGDASPMDDQYEFTKILLGFAKELGVREVYSIGARWTENPLPPEVDPEPAGFSSDRTGVAKLKKHGVRVLADEPAPFFASLVVAMAAEHGMRGYKLSVDHGEPSPHARSVAKLLGALSELVGFDVPLDELKAQTNAPPAPAQGRSPSIYH